LKCVIYYHVAPIGRLKKGIITYKIANGIFALWKHLEATHWNLTSVDWMDWIRKKMG
jgi:hypothetical protein